MTDRGGFASLDACVHCGFCLQACPTFLVTGDEADGPRGRIELMRSLERGELGPDDPALRSHLDRCLGCRGCEPVCPAGVGYGRGLEAARARIAERHPPERVARLALRLLTSTDAAPTVYALGRLFRATGIPTRLAGWGRLRFTLGMLGATQGSRQRGTGSVTSRGTDTNRSPLPALRSPVQLFRGCVMEGLFAHVHDATARTLRANGYDVQEVLGQVCCGALHAHAGLLDDARRMARLNIAAFPGDAPIVVNSAGCGALLRDYGHLLPNEPDAAAFAARVRDISELLALRGPASGAPLPYRVAYDAPCHLQHAQGVTEPPLTMLRAIPDLDLRETPDSAQCCGSAGLFTLAQPEMSRNVLRAKLARLREDPPDVLATGNPGCLMQLGAGLRAAGLRTVVRHPVELLDESYARAGWYGSRPDLTTLPQ